MGRLVEYRQPVYQKYSGNPLIEALPLPMSTEDFIKRTLYLPEYYPELRLASDEDRALAISDAVGFFMPLPRHDALQRAIGRMLREGYATKNPVEKDYWKQIEVAQIEFRKDLLSIREKPRTDNVSRPSSSTGLNGLLVGVSGIGKTLTVESILATYPQLIEHGRYFKKAINIRQVVWLTLNCPHKSSLIDLCNSFFRSLDDILGTNYLLHHGNRREHEMLGAMGQLASTHALGLLVIDEIQELRVAQSSRRAIDSQAILNFLLRLTNKLKVPVLLIGTPRCSPLFNSELRHLRRLTGQGIPVWDVLSKGIEWDMLIEAMWAYQYTRTPVPLTDEMSRVIYDETQGITDFAVKLYMLTQDIIIASNREAGNQSEIITPEKITETAKMCLAPVKVIVEAIKSNKRGDLVNLDDVSLPEYPKMRERYIGKFNDEEFLNKLNKTVQQNGLAAAQKGSDIERTNQTDAPQVLGEEIKVQQTTQKIISAGMAQNKSLEEALKDANLLGAGDEFIGG